jgi:hypothetical protein
VGEGFDDSAGNVNDFWEFAPSMTGNQPPVAKASIKEYYSPTSVVLTGTGSSDPEGGSLKYAWTKVAGPDTYDILFPDNIEANVVHLVNGTYAFRLAVTDDKGLTSTSDVTLTVKQNNPPVAKAWLAEYKSSNSVLLSGWASYDPDGGAVTYQWSYVSGPASYTITDGTSYNATISGLTTGTYTFRLTVKDVDGATSFMDVIFDIKTAGGPSNAAPIAKASYDPEGKPVTYQWTYVSGPSSYTITDGTSYNATISNLVAGTYTFRLTVKDDMGATASEDVTFTMNAMARNGARTDLSVYDQNIAGSKLNVYPNPVDDMLQYKWSSVYKGNAKLTVMDISGRMIKVMQLEKQQDDFIKTVNLAGLKPGTYYVFIQMQTGKKISAMFLKK